jgi:TonB family protein
MAIGDELKLSSDGLLRAGESAGNTPGAHVDAYGPPESLPGFSPPAKGVSPAGDVWSLGITLVEVLTQRLPARDEAEQGNDPQLPPDLPEPFLDIARHSLLRNPEDRWTFIQIAARLENLNPLRQVRTPARPARPASPPQAMPVKRRPYAIPIAIGVLLAAILLVPKLFRRNSAIVHAPAAALHAPANRPIARPQAPLRAEDDALVHPAADGSAPGEVLERVLPDVPESARDTIQGTVRVTVRVDVDPSGEVQFAELQTRGPSTYFATLAMQAAQHWGFRPPKVSGQSILSTWTLRFEFTRAGTTVIPTQEIP